MSSLHTPAQPVVMIRSMGPAHRERVARHLLALSPDDRYLRFGYAAGDAHIRRYVDGLNFGRDDVFGIVNRRLELLAMAHLAYADAAQSPSLAEFGVSVLPHARGRGYGRRLFERAVVHARNQGVEQLLIHALTENKAMLSIAAHAGARLVRDGSETEATLQLPPANFDTLLGEVLQEQLAQSDYRWKAQVHMVRQWLRGVSDWCPLSKEGAVAVAPALGGAQAQAQAQISGPATSAQAPATAKH
jgi:GNAT superfamily N-acetyltransferase